MLYTKHVRLRAIEEEDLTVLAAWRSDPEVYGYFHEYVPLSMRDQRDWYERQRTNKAELNFAVTTPDNKLLGTAGLGSIDTRSRKAEVSRILIGDPKNRNSSIGLQILLLVFQYGFEHMNLHRLYGEVLASNAKAMNYYKGFGVQEEGILRQHVFKDGGYQDVIAMGILRDEYMASKENGLVKKLITRYL